MNLNRFFKNLFGLCNIKGCRRKSDFITEIKVGNKKCIIMSLCEEHASKLIEGGSLKSITYQRIVDFSK